MGSIKYRNNHHIFAFSVVQQKITGWLHRTRKTFLCLILINAVSSLAILRANVYYIDDIGRACFGYKGWENFSRYLTNFLSGFIHTDSYLSDISPLPQILALLIMSFAEVIVIEIVSGKTEFSFWSVLAVLPLGLSPYFLECLSYRYDAPYMALSVLVSAAPFLILRSCHKYNLFFLGSVLGILMMCTTYQASSGIFPMLVIFICIRRWNDADAYKDIGTFILTSALAYGTGLAVFRVFLMKPVKDYVSNALPAAAEWMPVVMRHLNQYVWHIRSDFTRVWKVLILLLCVAFVLCMACQSKRNKLAACLLTGGAFTVMGLMSFGIYPLLEAPLYEPRAMYGFGAFLAIMGVYTSGMGFPGVKLPAVTLAWVFFVFSFTYGNALSVQKEYTDFRTSAVIGELNGLEACASDEIKNVQIAGDIGHAPALAGVLERYGILKRLVPVTFRADWMWGDYKFQHYYGLKNVVPDYSVDLRTCNLPIIKNTMYFTIRGNEKELLVELK